jgi:hypothetical protein
MPKVADVGPYVILSGDSSTSQQSQGLSCALHLASDNLGLPLLYILDHET